MQIIVIIWSEPPGRVGIDDQGGVFQTQIIAKDSTQKSSENPQKLFKKTPKTSKKPQNNSPNQENPRENSKKETQRNPPKT